MYFELFPLISDESKPKENAGSRVEEEKEEEKDEKEEVQLPDHCLRINRFLLVSVPVLAALSIVMNLITCILSDYPVSSFKKFFFPSAKLSEDFSI